MTEVECQAVFEQSGGQKKAYEGASARPFSGSHGGQGGRTDVIHVPAEIPAGKYHVYYRFTENGKSLGQTRALDVELGAG